MATDRAGGLDDQHYRFNEIRAPSSCGDVVSRLCSLHAGTKGLPSIELSARHPEVPALQADLKPGGGRFKKVNYINPDDQFEKDLQWLKYFRVNSSNNGD